MAREVIYGVAAALLLLAACTKREEEAAPAATAESSASTATATTAAPTGSTFSEVDQSLKAGSFDDAAAKLLEMRTVRQDFTPQEAADYRRKLNEAYSAALEAADRGDARAKAAIEMIRANPGR
jgi:hypothetical protein